ncbi:MAG TPA: ABC-type transport auxiliary lipoprotein family protein [Thermomicrobiales bacterium]|nr:ABC-type transport auxiliary lipoprotein family protein [Thermomicrobiales bacterium]
MLLPRRLVAGALALALTGCARLFVAPPPKYLYRLTPEIRFPGGLPHRPVQLAIDRPLAPAGLDNRRIALAQSPISLDYFADALWVDTVPATIQTALVDGFEKSGAFAAVGRESLGLQADFTLAGEVRQFDAEYASGGGPPDAVVSIDIALIGAGGRNIVAQKLFEQRARAAANTLPAIVAAFDAALGAAIEAIVVWTAQNPALSKRRR